MITIVAFKQSKTEEGKVFNKLKIQGGVELVQSKESGKFYMTARTCYIPTTFDEGTCHKLIGTEMSGSVEKVNTEPYDYTVPETGEVISLTHRWEYSPIEPPSQVVQKKRDDLVVTEEAGW